MRSFNASAVLFAIMTLATLATLAALAPVFATQIGASPFESHIFGTVARHGHLISVLQANENRLQLGYTPIGPDWHFGPYTFGADSQGRDVGARLLYASRNSFTIATLAACFCVSIATALSLFIGYLSGWVERVVTWLLTMLWAVPVYLFASCLSMTMLRDGLHIGPITLQANNRAIPVCVIAAVYLPYASRILTARVRQIAGKTYVEAARGFGASTLQIICGEILPGLLVTIATFLPLLIALCLLAESALSFLSLGVQAPDASLGTMIHDGGGLIYSRPMVAILPGFVIILTVVSLYILADHGTRRWQKRDAS